MSSQHPRREVREGERHVYADTDRQHEGPSIPQHHPGRPTVLVNTRMKRAAVAPCPKTKTCDTKHQRQKKKTGKRTQDPTVSLDLPESGQGVYGSPEVYSALRLSKALQHVRREEADLGALVTQKLLSPNTGSKHKTQQARKVNIPDDGVVFQDLVSHNVSIGALEEQLKDSLHLRARAVRPVPQPRPLRPQPSDVCDPEAYVTTRACTKVTTIAPFCSVHTFTPARNQLCSLTNHVLATKFTFK